MPTYVKQMIFCLLIWLASGLPPSSFPVVLRQWSIGGFCITAALAVSSSAPGSPWPVGWQSNLGWRGPQDLSSPTPSLKRGQLWDQYRLLRALSGQVLKTFKDENCTTSLGNLIHCFIVPMVKMCLLIPVRAAVNCLALSLWHPSYTTWQAAVTYSQSHHFSRQNKPSSPSHSSQGKCSIPNHLGGPPINSL